MFNVEINGSEVFASDDALAAWSAFCDMCATMLPGDEVILWFGDKIEEIRTAFFPTLEAEEDPEAFALTEASPALAA